MQLLTTGPSGPQVISEIVPDGITVGYGGMEGEPLRAAISIEYPYHLMPMMSAAFKCSRDQKRTPLVAVVENDIQVSLTISPIPEWCRSSLLPAVVGEAANVLKVLHVTSFADIDQDHESFKKFLEYFERDKFFLVTLHTVGGLNRPLDTLQGVELLREIQTFT